MTLESPREKGMGVSLVPLLLSRHLCLERVCMDQERLLIIRNKLVEINLVCTNSLIGQPKHGHQGSVIYASLLEKWGSEGAGVGRPKSALAWNI